MNAISRSPVLDIEPHRGELETLLRLLEVGKGCFSLSIAVCNIPVLRDRLIDEVQRRFANLSVLTIPPQTIDVYGFVCDHVAADHVSGLFLVGLEACVSDSRTDQPTLRSLNASRDLWLDRFPLPVVIWIPEYAARALSETARDFWRIRSHRFGFLSADQNSADRLIGSSAVSSTWVISLSSAEKKARVIELERRLAEVGDPLPTMHVHVLSWLAELAMLHRLLGDLDAAEHAVRRQIAMAELTNDQISIANALMELGQIHMMRGHLDAAETALRQSLAINLRLNQKIGLAGDYVNLGVAYLQRGFLDNAVEMFEKALEIDENLGRIDAVACECGNLGLIRMRKGDFDGAEELFNKALKLHGEVGNEDGIARDCQNLGTVFEHRGDLVRAEEAYQRALGISERLGLRLKMAYATLNLGIVAERRGDFENARVFCARARDLFAEIGVQPMVAEIQARLDLLPETSN